jgi:hypothetical protein
LADAGGRPDLPLIARSVTAETARWSAPIKETDFRWK